MITLTYSHLMAVAWEERKMTEMAMMMAVVVVAVVVEGDIVILFCSQISLRPFTGPLCLTVTTELAADRGQPALSSQQRHRHSLTLTDTRNTGSVI